MRTIEASDAEKPFHRAERLFFPLLVMLIYVAIMSLAMSRHDWDPSRFIVAGDRYVDPAKTPSPIEVRVHSDGYDGQFYYRLALDPWTKVQTANGVTIDSPSWRQQRIGYPLVAHLLSFGHPEVVAYILLIVNLISIAAIAYFARGVQTHLQLPQWFSWSVIMWPGLIVSLTHDTTEILALALMTAAIYAYLSGRLIAYALLAALTTLTRETALVLFGGIFLYESAIWLKSPSMQRFVRLILFGLVALPYLLWWLYLTFRWGVSPQHAGNGGNVGIPFGGLAQALWRSVTDSGSFGETLVYSLLHRTALASLAVLVVVSGVLVFSKFSFILRRPDGLPALAFGWAILALTLSTLTGSAPASPGGPWVDATAAYRAFGEYWLVSSLLLAVAGTKLPRWLAVPAFLIWDAVILIMV